MPKEDKPFDLLFGLGKNLGAKINERAAELSQKLAEGMGTPPETGAKKGGDIDQMLTYLYRLSLGPATVGTVLDTFEYTTEGKKTVRLVRVIVDRRIVEAICPAGLEPQCGTSVRLHKDTNQIVGLTHELPHGPVATVREVKNDSVTVEIAGSSRSVRRSLAVDCSQGDRVVLDEMQLVIVGVLQKDSQRFTLTRAPKNTFEDIVGQDNATTLLREVIDLDPAKDAIARHYNRPRIKGVVLFGPPGCGKTMIGEGVAARMAQQHNSSTQGYFYVKGPEFLNMYVGETERGIRNCFEEADKHYEKTGFPATLVFDECESLLSRRGSSNGVDMEKTVVPTFLSLMNETTALVILMTNRADTLDPAVIRDGRFDRQIFIGRPTRDSAEIIIRKNLSRYPLDKGGPKVEALARTVTDAFFDPAKHLIDEAFELANGKEYFTLANVVNGAMLARLVSDAVLIAERRDRKSGQLSGVSEQDLLSALDTLYAEKRQLDHNDELKEFFVSLKDRLPSDNTQRQTMNS